MQRPDASIIIPVYQAKKYINQCLDSVINQTYDNYEIIIIDDGSTDGSGEICDDYAMENPSIKVFHQANQGVTIARKRGLGCSSGKYIFWLDADDYFDTRQFKYYMNILATIDVDLVLTDYDFVSESGDVTGTVTYPFLSENELSIEECINNPLFKDIQMHGVTYKRSNLETISYNQTEGISYTDQEWVFIPICTVNRLFYVKNSLYKYLVGRVGQTVDLSVYHKRVRDREKLVVSMLNSYLEFKKKPTYKKYQSFLDTRIKEALESIYMSYLIVNRELGDLPLFDTKIQELAPEIHGQLCNTPVSKFLPYKYIKHWLKTQSLPPVVISKAYLFLKKIQAKLS